MKKETPKKLGFGMQPEKALVYSYPHSSGGLGLFIRLQDGRPLPFDVTVSVPSASALTRTLRPEALDMQLFIRAEDAAASAPAPSWHNGPHEP